MKKTVLLFVFDGFADYEISYLTASILKGTSYQMKTIALEKLPIRALSGICVLPDLDFLPDIDLADMDNTNTAMLILPGGSIWDEEIGTEIVALIQHCINNQIPVITTSNSTGYLDATSSYHHDAFHYQHAPIQISTFGMERDIHRVEFSNTLVEMLHLNDHENTVISFHP